LLADLDTYSPSLGLMFGITDGPPGLAAACRLVSQGRFDEQQLTRLSSKFEAGAGELSLLAGLSSASRWPEASSEKLSGIISVVEPLFDFVIFDLSSPLEEGVRQVGGALDRNGVTRSLIQGCDKTLAVVGADAISMQRFLSIQTVLAELVSEPLILVNRLRNSALGANPKQQISDALQRFAGQSVDWFVPNDPDSCDQAALEAVPLAMMKRSSPARQALAQLARLKFMETGNQLQARVAKLG
jgi:MinD-like ATPase involved in chromosome partitioning or flagellar assembly